MFFNFQQDIDENQNEQAKIKKPNVAFQTKKNQKQDNEVTLNICNNI